jgi:hypothetical protein
MNPMVKERKDYEGIIIRRILNNVPQTHIVDLEFEIVG